MNKKFFCGLILVFLLVLAAYGEGKLFCYNTVDRLLGGNTWVYTTSLELERCLIQYPRQWGCLLLGTTLQEMKNGEIVGWGTVNNHRFFWVSPEYPFTSNLLDNQKINLALLAVFDETKSQRFNLEKGVDIKETVINEMKKLNISTAAVEIQGVLKDVKYSVAYNLPHTGVDLKNLENYLSFFSSEKPAYWHLGGLYSENPNLQKAFSKSGPLHLHGLVIKSPGSDDKKSSQKGGDIDQATAEGATVTVYPLNDSKIFQANLAISDGQVTKDKITFKITNASPLWVEHVQMEGLSNYQKTFSFRLAPLSPFSFQTISVDRPASYEQDGLLVRVNDSRDIYEESYGNNQLFLGQAQKKENRQDIILYCRDESLWQMTAGGGNLKKIAGIPDDPKKIFRNPVWSPDRLKMVYYAFDKWSAPVISLLTTPAPTIFLFDYLTRKSLPVYKTEAPQTVVDDLCFSAGGDFLYFTRSQADVGESIVRVNLEDFKTEKIVDGAFGPDLSADGQSLAYVAYNSGYKNIVISNLQGQDKRIILSYGKFVDFSRPCFNPQASKIVFSAVAAGGDKPLWQLWLYDLNKDTVEKLVKLEGVEPFKVCWSPDGQRIIFSLDGKIFSYDFKSGDPVFIASGDGPNWF